MNQARSYGKGLLPAPQRAALLAGLKFRPFLPAHGEIPQVQPPLIVLMRTQHMTPEQLRHLLVCNPRDAVRWIIAAAQAGFSAAQVVLGQLLLDGRGVDRDAVQAFAWFEAAAEAGDPEARNMIGRCHEQGWGVPQDPYLAAQAFEGAARQGHVWGQVNFAQMLMRAGDPADRPRCFEMFRAAAEGGTSKPHLKAMNSLARFLEEGWGGAPDPASAAVWYLKAATLGDHWAQYNLATILYGRGDEAAAGQWLQRAVAIGDNGFRRRIAPLLLACPAPALRRHGLDALQRCALSDLPDDLYAYALALHEGVAGVRDLQKAQALFKRAADQGYVQALQDGAFFSAMPRGTSRFLCLARCCLALTRFLKTSHGKTS